jgi:hypothetical protein
MGGFDVDGPPIVWYRIDEDGDTLRLPTFEIPPPVFCGRCRAWHSALVMCGVFTPWKVATSTPAALCPDLLRYEQIGVADGWRGRVVRAFFWLMRAWPNAGREK